MRRSWTRAGAAFSVALHAGCSQHTGVAGGPPSPDSVTVARFGMFSFGASGVTQLPDGRIIIAEDEKLHPFVIVDLFRTGAAREFLAPEVAAAFSAVGVTDVNDLEGITHDSAGHLYATTSHTIPRSGQQTTDRRLVVRFDVRSDSLAEISVLHGLDTAMAHLDTTLAESIGKNAKTRGPSPGLNIEGIAWDPRADQLLFGLRGPLRDGRALIVRLTNVDAAFRGAPLALAGPYVLDLAGQGIRDITFDPSSGGFLIIAGSSGMSAWGHAALWWWSGNPGDAPKHLRASVLDPLKPEGIAVLTLGNRRVLVFVCDDGTLDTRFYKGKSTVNEGIPSRFVVVPYGVLLRDNPTLPSVAPIR